MNWGCACVDGDFSHLIILCLGERNFQHFVDSKCTFLCDERLHMTRGFLQNPLFHCLVQRIFSVKKGKNELIFLKILIFCGNGSWPKCNSSLSSGNRILQSTKFSCCTNEEVQMPSHFLNQFDDHI